MKVLIGLRRLYLQNLGVLVRRRKELSTTLQVRPRTDSGALHACSLGVPWHGAASTCGNSGPGKIKDLHMPAYARGPRFSLHQAKEQPRCLCAAVTGFLSLSKELIYLGGQTRRPAL